MTDDDDADSARVEELVATVDGLTTELLDLQERVRELEAELEDQEPPETQSVEEMFAQGTNGTDAKQTELEDVETIGDDIIVG
jgi:cell division protein ZapA (FtsZ GTPase activity inhibitor)